MSRVWMSGMSSDQTRVTRRRRVVCHGQVDSFLNVIA